MEERNNREREREREKQRERGTRGQMHLASCPNFELKIVNDKHGIYGAQNCHSFRDTSRRHDISLDNLRQRMHVSHYFLSCAVCNG